MTSHVIRANALALPLRDASVDLIVTSPPYFALRSYQDGGDHYAGQIGSEPTPAGFVDALLTATVEMVRVLKPSGSLWINLGDKYAGGGGYAPNAPSNVGNNRHGDGKGGSRSTTNRGAKFGLRQKSLIGVPWRYALRCIDELGLILRAEVIWAKPNGLPESVTDRVRRSHETWFHFTKAPKYYSGIDEIREPHLHPHKGGGEKFGRHERGMEGFARHSEQTPHPLGKLPGSVWTIATQPLKVPAELGIDHFAAFPMEWPRRIIRGWSPPGICTACGEGRRPVATPTGERGRTPGGQQREDKRTYTNLSTASLIVRTITGHACSCAPYTDHPGTTRSGPRNSGKGWAADTGDRDNPGGGYGNAERTGPWREYHLDDWVPPATTPAVVLDPFGGTGTTALLAKVLGRRGVSVDMSADYCRLAQWRTNDPKQIDRATNPKAKPARKGAAMPRTSANNDDIERIRRRHPDIPQDPLPLDVPDQPAQMVSETRARPAKSVRFAACPKCLADREFGVIRRPDGVEVFRDHNKTIGKGRRMPCPGSGTIAPAVKP